MSAACLTQAEFLTATGSLFTSIGVASTGSITVASTGSPGDTVSIGGATLAAVAGARTLGGNDFSLASATNPGIAASIVDAVNDPLNAIALGTIATASLRTPGLAIVDLESVDTGVYSLLPLTSSAPLVHVLSAATLTGGDATLANILDCACQMMAVACWGAKRSLGHQFLTSHLLTVGDGTGSGGSGSGTVSSKSIDKLSISYAVTAFDTSDASVSSTKYGRQYLALRGSLVRFGAVSGGWGVC